MIMKQATSAGTPAVGPISSLTSSPSERPSRRVETNSTIKSCTAPASTTPARSDHPRQVAHLRGEHRAHQRPRAGNGGKMVTEQHFLSVGT